MTYEYVRYYMHSQLKLASSDSNNLIDLGVGVMSGGLGGIAVSIWKRYTYRLHQPDSHTWCIDGLYIQPGNAQVYPVDEACSIALSILIASIYSANNLLH